ncbi:alpha/beta hydrolase [Companilactobacillus mishanensis]|uniref:alpha/beta hydrolase n=1 Tax=Companilactobacillus mishanensis TaxID=2486008 RepID=UPI001297950F|nr:alpha/beta fold hydrolase [Companilactobacillus mishanensis]MQS89793.1 alpha/beta hydrolase [Companilactobacillus mishanensis]
MSSKNIVEEYRVTEGSRFVYMRTIRQKSLAEPAPTMIFSHGLGETHKYLMDYANHFAEKGYVCVVFDFCGGGDMSRSSGKTSRMSIFTEQEDLETIIGFTQSLKYVDNRHIILVGASQGGAVSAMVADEIPNEIESLVLMYPAFNIPYSARKTYATVDAIPDHVFQWVDLGKVYFEKLLDYEIYDHIANFEKPVLIIHGDQDKIVPIRYSEKAEKVYKNVELKVIEGSGHGFYEDDRSVSMKLFDDFISKLK